VLKIISVTCMSAVPTDLNFCYKNHFYVYHHVLQEVMLWPLYYRCRMNLSYFPFKNILSQTLLSQLQLDIIRLLYTGQGGITVSESSVNIYESKESNFQEDLILHFTN
jgi:hypothetical protein